MTTGPPRWWCMCTKLKNHPLFDGASYEDLLKHHRIVHAQAGFAGKSGGEPVLGRIRQFHSAHVDRHALVTIVAFYRDPGAGDGWKVVIEKNKLDVDADKQPKLELVDQLLLVPVARPRTPLCDAACRDDIGKC